MKITVRCRPTSPSAPRLELQTYTTSSPALLHFHEWEILLQPTGFTRNTTGAAGLDKQPRLKRKKQREKHIPGLWRGLSSCRGRIVESWKIFFKRGTRGKLHLHLHFLLSILTSADCLQPPPKKNFWCWDSLMPLTCGSKINCPFMHQGENSSALSPKA